MTIEKIDKYLKETLGGWNYLDLFYPFCESKGYEDPEDNPDVTEDLYERLEREFCEYVTYEFLRNLVDACCQEVNERISAAFPYTGDDDYEDEW